jgi:hypothetical protein
VGQYGQGTLVASSHLQRHRQYEINHELGEQIGWPELVEQVAQAYDALPADERARTAILTENYGELGAVNLYGPAHGLPEGISGVNSAWWYGYPDPSPRSAPAALSRCSPSAK